MYLASESESRAEDWKAFGRAVSSDALWNHCVFEPMADPGHKPAMRTDRLDGLGVSEAVMPPLQITTFGAGTPVPSYQIARVNQVSTLQVEGQPRIRLAPDELVICSTHMRSVWTIDRGYTTGAIHVDEHLFTQFFPAPSRLIGRRLELPFEFGEILHQIMDAGIAIAGTHRFRANARSLIGSFLQILALLPDVGGQERPPEQSALELRRYQIKSYIRRNFADPDLSIKSVAQHFGVTPRYVQKTFAADGMTPGEYLRRCRLEASSRMLVANESVGLGITKIAFDCGFASSAHFSNEFRRYFGLSPREFRKHH